MAIIYPVDVENTKWAIVEVATGSVIHRHRTWPRADGEEIQGDDGTFVYLLHKDAAQPDYDSRLYTLDSTEEVDAPANEIRLSWEAVARPNEERIISAENVEAAEMGKHLNLARMPLETYLMVTAILKFILDAEQFPVPIQPMINRFVAKGTKFYKNRDVLLAWIEQIENGEDPDFDTGMEPSE